MPATRNAAGRYHCDECTTRFASKASLDAHLVKAHGHASLRCSVCGQGFGDRNNLNRHKRNKHGADKHRYCCSVCPGIMGNRSDNIKRHTLKKVCGGEVKLLPKHGANGAVIPAPAPAPPASAPPAPAPLAPLAPLAPAPPVLAPATDSTANPYQGMDLATAIAGAHFDAEFESMEMPMDNYHLVNQGFMEPNMVNDGQYAYHYNSQALDYQLPGAQAFTPAHHVVPDAYDEEFFPNINLSEIVSVPLAHGPSLSTNASFPNVVDPALQETTPGIQQNYAYSAPINSSPLDNVWTPAQMEQMPTIPEVDEEPTFTEQLKMEFGDIKWVSDAMDDWVEKQCQRN